ncbi:fluoride efflux transporter CrcB [Enterococcus ratti]|uniref:Fluoride-specific ion channel FluC n=1 Tax=Enterococcus ratti TaxID=150033 RepID=A0A1L8WNW8_9ENTE|nr:fluoride efflux transporter CrcB [Enterococcus ratti]OJG82709.1 protein CrcB [Enterococcus ratti]
MVSQYILVGIGCFLGGCLRNFFSHQYNSSKHSYPLGTFIANIVGAFLIGFFCSSFIQREETLYLFLATGFCGGLTTFSTFNSEVMKDFMNGKITSGFYYWIGSFICSILAVFLGFFIGQY